MKRIIDKETGLFLRDDYTYDGVIEIGLSLPDDKRASGFIIPKWDFELEQWVEGATQEYIDGLQSEVPTQALNLEEKVLEHEEKIVTLEETLDVIFGGSQ